MMRLGAAWIVPVDAPPVRDGWVAVDQGRIVAVGGTTDCGDTYGPLQPLGRVALMPGLVNAHTHLELSWLRGRVPPAAAFTSWVRQLLVERRRLVERPDDPVVVEAARLAAREARACGTVAVGDISNSLASVTVVGDEGLGGVVFHELIGFRDVEGAEVARTADLRARAAGAAASGVRVAVTAHAPYSVSPELFRAVHAAAAAGPEPRMSVHVAESVEELELLATGTGEWARMLRSIGAWRDDWTPPGTGPVEYLDALGVIDQHTLLVHGVQLGEGSLERIRARGATLVTCPRSNQWVGAGAPPVERFYRAGVPVAVGTDSLASVEDLNLFEELKALRRLAPGVPAGRLIESATLTGARALGLDAELGSISPGKRAALLRIAVPEDVTDIEEYLVGGIHPSAIAWT